MVAVTRRLVLLLVLAAAAAPWGCGVKIEPGGDCEGVLVRHPAGSVTYVSSIADLLSRNCLGCHSSSKVGPDRNGAPAGRNWDSYAGIMEHLRHADERVQAGIMPPGGGVSATDRELFHAWACAGGPETAGDSSDGDATEQEETAETNDGDAADGDATEEEEAAETDATDGDMDMDMEMPDGDVTEEEEAAETSDGDAAEQEDSAETADGDTAEEEPAAEDEAEAEAEAEDEAEGPTTHEVSIKSFAFTPRALTVKVGDTVRFRNDETSNIPHTVATGTPGAKTGVIDTDPISPGDHFDFRFDTAGSHSYFCEIHTSMTGSVTVEP